MISYTLFCVAALALAFLALRRFESGVRRDLKEGARQEYDRLRRQAPTMLEGLDPEVFAAVYERTQMPRFPRYLLVVIALFAFGSPIVLGALSGAAWLAQEWGVVASPGDVATELYLGAGSASIIRRTNPETLSYIVQGWSGFYYFFGMLAFWIGIVFVVMRRYHRRSPGSLEEEVLRAH